VLDHDATVGDALTSLRAEPFQVLAPVLPNAQRARLFGRSPTRAPTRRSLEPIDRTLVIPHGKACTVMADSPSFDHELALNRYGEGIGDLTFLPGASGAADLESFPRGPTVLAPMVDGAVLPSHRGGNDLPSVEQDAVHQIFGARQRHGSLLSDRVIRPPRAGAWRGRLPEAEAERAKR